MGKSWGQIGSRIGIIFLPAVTLAFAEESSGPLPPAPPAPKVTTKSPLIQKRGKRREQKETEGTEAPERFEADTILKSNYSVDGQPLEVDPD